MADAGGADNARTTYGAATSAYEQHVDQNLNGPVLIHTGLCSNWRPEENVDPGGWRAARRMLISLYFLC